MSWAVARVIYVHSHCILITINFVLSFQPELCSLPHTSTNVIEDDKANIEMVIDPCIQEEGTTMVTDNTCTDVVLEAAVVTEETPTDPNNTEQTAMNIDEETVNGATDAPENDCEN